MTNEFDETISQTDTRRRFSLSSNVQKIESLVQEIALEFDISRTDVLAILNHFKAREELKESSQTS